VGEQFVRSLAARDRSRLFELLHPELDFRAMRENRSFRSRSAERVVDDLMFGDWFHAADHVDVERVVHEGAGNRARLRYRLRVTESEHVFRVDHRAYIDVRDGQITWMSIMCSGGRPPIQMMR
jgi:hypothetical protein